MEKEKLIIEVAALVHEDWCKQELEAFYNRTKKIYMSGDKSIKDALNGACYKGDTKRNEIFIDVPFMVGNETFSDNCLDSFDSFIKLIKLGGLEVKRFTTRNLTDEEIKIREKLGDYKSESKEENILVDFKLLSKDSQKENLDAAISAYAVFEDMLNAGISLDEMYNSPEIRNQIGIGIHTDWLKRNPNHSNDSLKVPYSELDDWTKQQDLTVFDALLKVVKYKNINIEHSIKKVDIPNYSEEERKVLEQIRLQKQDSKVINESQKEDKILGLFVANQIYDDFELIEPWVQYDSFGRVLHRLVVFPKKVLLYSKIDENGEMAFYNFDTNKKIKVVNYEPLCSYETDANCGYNLVAMGKMGYSTGVASINKEIMREIKEGFNEYGLVVPFEEFCEEKFGKKMEHISLTKAKILLRLSNLFVGKPIVLSIDPEIAEKQLEKIGYVKNKEKNK